VRGGLREPSREPSPRYPGSAAIVGAIGDRHAFKVAGQERKLGTLEKAAAMTNHATMRTTQAHDRGPEEMSVD